MLRTADIEAVEARAARLYKAGKLDGTMLCVVQSYCSRALTADFEGRPRQCSMLIGTALLRCDEAEYR